MKSTLLFTTILLIFAQLILKTNTTKSFLRSNKIDLIKQQVFSGVCNTSTTWQGRGFIGCGGDDGKKWCFVDGSDFKWKYCE